MIQYTYTKMESFVIQHLYYSMGVNRMKWYEYNNLMAPSLKREIGLIIPIKDGYNKQDLYNRKDIDAIIREMKEKYQLFGHYEGSKKIYDSILDYMNRDKQKLI